MKLYKNRSLVLIKIFCLIFVFTFSFYKSNNSKGVIYSKYLINHNKIDSAISYCQKQISLSTSDVDKAFYYVELGSAYKLKQQYDKSLEFYQKALNIFKKKKLPKFEFYVYTQLIEYYRYRRMYQNASDYMKLCESILKKIKIDDAYLMPFYGRKAAVLSEFYQDKDEALLYSKKSLNIAKKLGNLDGQLSSLLEISGIYENKKKYKDAVDQLNVIVDLAKKNNNIQMQCDAMVNLARNFNFLGDYDESIAVSLKGLSLSEKNGLSFNQLLFADNLKAVYEKKVDYPNAYKYLKIRLKLTEDFYQNLYDDKILEYEERFKTAEKERIISENSQLLELKEQEIKRQDLIRYVFIFGLIVLLIFAGVLMYYINVKRTQNQKLIQISEHNNFLVSETHHRINNNLQLVRILIENELNKNPNIDKLTNKRIVAKIDSMGILHRKLYKSQDKKLLSLNDFLTDIQQNLDLLFNENDVKVNFNIDNLYLPVNTVMYLGLLVTELCINTLKHAFPIQNEKEIFLEIKGFEDRVYFNYEDNGQQEKSIKKLDLIDKLCRQLRVDYKIDVERGFKINFIKKL